MQKFTNNFISVQEPPPPPQLVIPLTINVDSTSVTVTSLQEVLNEATSLLKQDVLDSTSQLQLSVSFSAANSSIGCGVLQLFSCFLSSLHQTVVHLHVNLNHCEIVESLGSLFLHLEQICGSLQEFSFSFKDNTQLHDVDILAEFIQKCSILTSIEITTTGTVIGMKYSRVLMNSIRYCSKLRDLSIDFASDFSISRLETTPIGKILSHCKRLRSLCLRIPQANIDSKNGEDLAAYLKNYGQNMQRIALSLESHAFSFDALNSLAVSLALYCKNLVDIAISFSDKHQSHLFAMLYVLAASNGEVSLTPIANLSSDTFDKENVFEHQLSLQLASVNVGDAGIKLYAPLFKHVKKLDGLYINLASACLGNLGLVEVAKNLLQMPVKHLHTLHLDFSFNYIGELGIKGIGEFVALFGNSLRDFAFESAKSGLCLHEIQPIIDAILCLQKLEVLRINLRDNPTLNSSAFVQIAHNIQHLEYLQHFTLQYASASPSIDQADLRSNIHKRAHKMIRLVQLKFA